MEMASIPVLSVIAMLLVDVVSARDRGQQHENVGRWTVWTAWSLCSQSCGSGIITRTRYWEQPPGEKKFERPYTMSQNSGCNEGGCPVDGSWNIWAHWSPCTEACGGGIARRNRTCNAPWHGGKDCEGDNFEEEECNRVPCPPLPPRFNLSSCTSKHFMCSSRRMCIPMDELCDNTVQCHDGSDEKKCYGVHGGDSVWYSFHKDTGSTFGASLSAVISLVVMVIMMFLIG